MKWRWRITALMEVVIIFGVILLGLWIYLNFNLRDWLRWLLTLSLGAMSWRSSV